MEFLPIKAADVSLQLIRPLPTILAYAKGTQTVDIVPTALAEEFDASVHCLIDLVETASLHASIPGSVSSEVCRRAMDLVNAHQSELPQAVNDLLFHLTRMSEMHKTDLKREIGAQKQVYRDIFWGRVPTKKITLVHQGDEEDSVAKLVKTLSEDCSYEVTAIAEEDVPRQPLDADLMVFYPTNRPVDRTCMETAVRLGVPTLVLIDLGKNLEAANPVMVRAAHLYAKDGMNVLHRPFIPLRLFSAIDKEYVEHLFRKPALAAAREQSEVA